MFLVPKVRLLYNRPRIGRMTRPKLWGRKTGSHGSETTNRCHKSPPMWKQKAAENWWITPENFCQSEVWWFLKANLFGCFWKTVPKVWLLDILNHLEWLQSHNNPSHPSNPQPTFAPRESVMVFFTEKSDLLWAPFKLKLTAKGIQYISWWKWLHDFKGSLPVFGVSSTPSWFFWKNQILMISGIKFLSQEKYPLLPMFLPFFPWEFVFVSSIRSWVAFQLFLPRLAPTPLASFPPKWQPFHQLQGCGPPRTQLAPGNIICFNHLGQGSTATPSR